MARTDGRLPLVLPPSLAKAAGLREGDTWGMWYIVIAKLIPQ